jgi:hypothetical protein
LAAHSTWTIVSHGPPVLVLAFALSGENERVVVRVRSIRERISPWIARLITAVVLLVGTLISLDAIWWYLTGGFFIPG